MSMYGVLKLVSALESLSEEQKNARARERERESNANKKRPLMETTCDEIISFSALLAFVKSVDSDLSGVHKFSLDVSILFPSSG